MGKPLTKNTAYRRLGGFFENNSKIFVLFGTGLSCAVDSRFSMDTLKNHLLSEIPKRTLDQEQKGEWDKATHALTGGADLESAMNAIKDENLTELIIRITSEMLAHVDREYGIKILTGKISWPALPLFKRLYEKLHATNKCLDVATPNYDLLAEYAFERARIPYITGYYGGVCRQLGWTQAERSLSYKEQSARRGPKPDKIKEHIRLYKVHGSLNTFKIGNDVVENNSWICTPPNDVGRLMVTPGTQKYEKLHENRQELLGPFDDAIERNGAFLFLGFGFNDNQLSNAAIRRKLKDQQCPGLIVTRENNPRIDALLKECEKLWLVCKPQNATTDSTMILNCSYPDGLHVKNKRLWDAGEFAREILGGK